MEKKIVMTNKKILILINIAVAITAMQLVTQAQTNPAAPVGAGRGPGGGGGGGFGGFGGFGGGGRGAPTPWIEAGYNDHQNIIKIGSVYIPNIENAEPLKKQVEHFVDCVMNDKAPMTGAADGVNVVKVLKAAEESLATGKTVICR